MKGVNAAVARADFQRVQQGEVKPGRRFSTCNESSNDSLDGFLWDERYGEKKGIDADIVAFERLKASRSHQYCENRGEENGVPRSDEGERAQGR